LKPTSERGLGTSKSLLLTSSNISRASIDHSDEENSERSYLEGEHRKLSDPKGESGKIASIEPTFYTHPSRLSNLDSDLPETDRNLALRAVSLS
jgi:hypothetical protein